MKAELKKNGINQVLKGTDIFVEGDTADAIALVVKGKARVHTKGVNLSLGSGNFLGLCDLIGQEFSATYTADTNLVIYAFPAAGLNNTVMTLIKANKDYAPLMVTTLAKMIRDLSKILAALREQEKSLTQFLPETYGRYLELGKKTGTKTNPMHLIDDSEDAENAETECISDSEKINYYTACAQLPSEVQKAYFGVSATITSYHIVDEIDLVKTILIDCQETTGRIQSLAGPLILDGRSLFSNVLQQANTLQRAGEDIDAATGILDDVIDRVNSLENLMSKYADVELAIDHKYMEDAYFKLLNGSSGADDAKAGNTDVDISVLAGALQQITEYAECDAQTADALSADVEAFEALSDKFSTEDDARTLRRDIIKIYYDLYKKVFLKDFNADGETPVVIDLFLRYGFLSETLVSEEMQADLLSIDRNTDPESGDCAVYDIKQWLTLILTGKKEPSKSEFDMDYEENLRDMRKTGQITPAQQQELSGDLNAKFEYELNNMFKTNHRIVFGQVSAFVPFLFTEGCTTSLPSAYLSPEKLNAAFGRLLQIDYSAFYRESLYGKGEDVFTKEYIQEEVFPDFILMPIYGNKSVMWQELSGRRRNSKGRFLLSIFMENGLDGEMIRLFGRFRWELCRTMQGASWNNIQAKSLTSEYCDFVQFYRKNRDLSDDKKEKLKLQIQKCRNNTREVFVVDYENWIKHEAQGGLCLSKPVREILATYCPFVKELREQVSEQPMFRDAMARFNRERGKKQKEYDLRFKVWAKDGLEVPEEIVATKDFYVNM